MLNSSAHIEIINPVFSEILQKYINQGAIAPDDFKFVGITMSEAADISNGEFRFDEEEELDDEDDVICVIAINNFVDEPHWDFGPDSVEDSMRCVFQLIEEEYTIKDLNQWEACKAEIRANAALINESYELIDWNSECEDPFEGWSFHFYYAKAEETEDDPEAVVYTDKDGEEWFEEFEEDSWLKELDEDELEANPLAEKLLVISTVKDDSREDFKVYDRSYDCDKGIDNRMAQEATVTAADGKVKPAAFLLCTELKSVNLEDGLTRVGNLAFSGCSSLKEIRIPGTVKTIGNRAFAPCRVRSYCNVSSERARDYKESYEVTWYGNERIVKERIIEQTACENLEKVILEEGLESIGHSAFLQCGRIEGIIIPPTVKRIGADAFRGCTSLTRVVLSPVMTAIEEGTFAGCRNLRTIDIPESVKSIGSHAFDGCESLSELIIHGDKVEIGESAFVGTVNLRRVMIDGTVKTIGKEAFKQSGVEEFACKGVERIGSRAFEMSWLRQLPDLSVTKEIGAYAFHKCGKLKKVFIPSQIKELKTATFSECINLERAELGNGIDVIYDEAFYECRTLKNVELSNTLTYVGNRAFSRCEELGKVTIPTNLQEIGKEAFKGCTAIKSVIIPEKVVDLLEEAFADCVSLEQVLIQSKRIGVFKRAFANCPSLNKVEVTGEVRRVGEDVFKGCEQLKDIDGNPNKVWMLQDELHGVVRPNPLVIPAKIKTVSHGYVEKYDRFDSVEICEGVKEIESEAFYGQRFLKWVHIPGSVRYIGEEAFGKCPALSEVVIDDGVECLEGPVFENCPALKEIAIPGSVKTIPRHLFRGCHLNRVVLRDGVKRIENDSLENVEWVEIPQSVKEIETFGIAMGATIVINDYNREIINAAQRLRLRVLLRKDGVDTEINDYSDLWDEDWSMIDPKRLERAHELSVRQLDKNRFLVSGGRDDHIVTRLPQDIKCDCSDYRKGTYNCKHVLRVRLMKEDLDDFMAHGGKRIFW